MPVSLGRYARAVQNEVTKSRKPSLRMDDIFHWWPRYIKDQGTKNNAATCLSVLLAGERFYLIAAAAAAAEDDDDGDCDDVDDELLLSHFFIDISTQILWVSSVD